MQTPREIINRCLTFTYPERLPRDLWILPWAEIHYPDAVATAKLKFPSDTAIADYSDSPSSLQGKERYEVGRYRDEWGCEFVNVTKGIIGEVREPLIKYISDWKSVKPPYAKLPENESQARDRVNRFCAGTDKFVMANSCPRPWERYQFLRSTENALIDVLMPEMGFLDLIRTIHNFYLKELEFWVKTDVDAIWFMDDWGAQDRLLIPPRLWRELIKSMYRDYCDLAKSYGKFVFMHSDGFIIDILPDLIEVGIDAINSQLFCMDIEELGRRFKGKITFWGEIDRQHVLPASEPQTGRDAVRRVASNLFDPRGGLIAMFEFGPGANPETVLAVIDEWDCLIDK